MKFSILGSSSSGNCSYVEANNIKILIDAGFSGKKTKEKLNSIGINIEDINAIIVTHEHGDHIGGLGVISRKYNIPIYIAKESYNKISHKIGKIEISNLNFIKEDISFGDLNIKPFEVMHDAEKCFGYTFEYSGKKISYASDVGYIDNVVKENFKKSDIIAIESNYDFNMLMDGDYPALLKHRVKSGRGHLSNAQASKFITKVACDKLKKVYLMHISKDNNTKELAYSKAREFLERENINVELEIAGENTTILYEV